MSAGKTVGMPALSASTRLSSPPRVTSILLAEYEKVRLFTIDEPMLWFSWVTSERPGWFHSERTAGNGSSPHWLRSAFHESCVQRTIRRVLFVIAQSTRALSCRQSTGVSTASSQLLQEPPVGVVLGSDMSAIIARPPGLMRFAGMMSPGKRWPVRGSIGLGGEQPAMPGPLKSPLRSASVGTNAWRTSLRRSLFHSIEKKEWTDRKSVV